MDDILSVGKGWHREPMADELVVLDDVSGKIHSLRPPRRSDGEAPIMEQWTVIQMAEESTWCGWKISLERTKRQHPQSLAKWSAELLASGKLCQICFGKAREAKQSSSSGSSESYE